MAATQGSYGTKTATEPEQQATSNAIIWVKVMLPSFLL